MAQVNIKERIKEMRLRVLTEPLQEAAMQVADKSTIKSAIPQSLNETDLKEKTIDDNYIRKKSSKKKKVSKKNTEKEQDKRSSNVSSEIEKETYLTEELLKSNKTHSYSPNNKIQSKEEKNDEQTQVEQSYSTENTQAENKNESDGIVNLTDKWVELEMRSRLSGLEQQEKQTRAMLREIVDVLDRIETLEHVKPNGLTPPLSVTNTNKKTSKVKKLSWSEIIKRTLVVTGTFLVLTGIILGVLYYLFF